MKLKKSLLILSMVVLCISCSKGKECTSYTEMGDYLNKMEIDSCIYVAEGKEEIYSKHFKSQITRYYVTYKNVYDHFHM